MDNIINTIRNFSYNYYIFNEEIIHNIYLKSLSDLLRNNNFECSLEYHIFFNSYHRKNDEVKRTGGYIDLYLLRDNFSIAIEYDNGFSLKYRSIAKLLQSNTKMSIGIVRDKNNSYKDLQYNVERINFIKDKLGIKNQTIYLLSIGENKYLSI